MVLQNEIIIRKNQRITEEDINKSCCPENIKREENDEILDAMIGFIGLLLYM